MIGIESRGSVKIVLDVLELAEIFRLRELNLRRERRGGAGEEGRIEPIRRESKEHVVIYLKNRRSKMIH